MPPPDPAHDLSDDAALRLVLEGTAAETGAGFFAALVQNLNIRRALEQSGWRVAGANGAGRLLGMNASTLASRMKARGIRRP